MIELLIAYSLLDLGTWIGVLITFVAGLVNLARIPTLFIFVALFGARVFETYDAASVLTPFPYLMAAVAVVLAVVAHIVGLVVSSAFRWRRE